MKKDKKEALKKWLDRVAIASFAYPPLLVLYIRYAEYNAPAGAWDIIEILLMGGVIPAFGWLNYRYKTSPPNSYPILERLENNARFRFLCLGGTFLAFILLHELIDSVKPVS